MKKNVIPTITFLLFSIALLNAQSQDALWFEDFEGDWTANWYVDAGTWEVGPPTSGPNSAYAGNQCAATVLDGNYSEPVATRLIRHSSFVVPPASENPRFRFWYWFSFNSPGDWGEVQIKMNGGEWESISNKIDNQGGDAWSYGSIDISAYADSTVQLAFYFQSVNDGSSTPDVSSGWYIDNVSLITGPYILNNPEDFESGFGDWSVDEGSWEVGVPTVGPANVHSGQSCAGTNLDGNFQEPANSRLISPPFVVPPASENPRFRFWYWFSFNSSGDWGEVQISNDGGITWEAISSQFINTSGGAWTNFYIPLSAYINSTIQLAFYFQSVNDGSSTPDVSSGWYIDDISFEGIINTGIRDNVVNTLNIYPNPFSNQTTIDFSNPDHSKFKLSVFNTSGNKIFEMDNITSDNIVLKKGNLPVGIYIVELKGKKVFDSKMIIIE